MAQLEALIRITFLSSQCYDLDLMKKSNNIGGKIGATYIHEE